VPLAFELLFLASESEGEASCRLLCGEEEDDVDDVNEALVVAGDIVEILEFVALAAGGPATLRTGSFTELVLSRRSRLSSASQSSIVCWNSPFTLLQKSS